jgi:hypothetical protein
MKDNGTPVALKDAPLIYAPNGELGVVFLFANIYKKLQLRIDSIGAAFPDCTAYKQVGEREKKIRIEFEYRSSNFCRHGHDPKGCDWIVCWHHDWYDAPRHLEIIELKRFFGVPRKVWIQPALRTEWQWLDKCDRSRWSLSGRVTTGDFLLMYRTHPICAITDIFRCEDSRLKPGQAGWRDGQANFGRIERICKLDSPVFLQDMRNHRVLRTASFIRQNMQARGGLLVSEYWPYLYDMLRERNPKHRRELAKFAPERLSI